MKKYLLALIAIMGITYTGNSFGMLLGDDYYKVPFKNDTKKTLIYTLESTTGRPRRMGSTIFPDQEIKLKIPTSAECFSLNIIIIDPETYKKIGEKQMDFYDPSGKKLGNEICKPTKIIITQTGDGEYKAIVEK